MAGDVTKKAHREAGDGGRRACPFDRDEDPVRPGALRLPERGGRLSPRTAGGFISLGLRTGDEQGVWLDQGRTLTIVAPISRGRRCPVPGLTGHPS